MSGDSTNLKVQRIAGVNLLTAIDDALAAVDKLDAELYPPEHIHQVIDYLKAARRHAAPLEKRAIHLHNAYQCTTTQERS